MKKVLLIGDSIRLNYMPRVYRNLSGVAEVVGPEDNCRFAKYTFVCIRDWLERFGKPDIIHWNNGIWDAHNFGDNKTLNEVDEYVRDLLRVYEYLRQNTDAKIIFATSTPCNNNYTRVKNVDIELFNRKAVAALEGKVDDINDLHSLIKSDIATYICEDNLHLSKEGITVAGNQVTEYIKKYL